MNQKDHVRQEITRVPLDPLVRDRIVAEAHGNPMVLLHLPSTLTPSELAGGFWLPGRCAAAGHVESAFRRRFLSLPRDSRRLLLTAAAEPTGDVALLWSAAARSGRPEAAATALERLCERTGASGTEWALGAGP
ncbi:MULTISPECIES: hypothetical protein [unclassified Streptomyces]|uniref:hypothetical protein n=1 Tax=unclassified Streptomyces TaxID=2593676 RepID=UPI00036F0BE3|nr:MULTISPECIES: hypothetical protein [unclassified Streptomyces]